MLISAFADLRTRDFARLDRLGTAYLDHTGAALYPDWLPLRHAELLAGSLRGNPHAASPVSMASTSAIDRLRDAVLTFFDADPAVYEVVLMANASAGLRLIAETFPFTPASRFVLSSDNHNSVHGIRLAAERAGASVDYAPLDDSLRPCNPRGHLPPAVHSLFAFPAQSNFSGVQHPLEFVGMAHGAGYRVLLDAAAFVPTHRLSLREVPADFVTLSFYKMFGYPTGVGALIASRDALAQLGRGYFAGGTVEFVSVQNRMHRMRTSAEAFEDGTPDFLAADAVVAGLRWLTGIGMDRIAAHTAAMTAALLERLHALGSAVEIYGPVDMQERGGTVAFNIRGAGGIVPFEIVERACAEADVSVRGGCFCNPGAAEAAFRLEASAARSCLEGDFSIARFRSCMEGRPVGAIRASVGIATCERDLDRLLDVLMRVSRSHYAPVTPRAV